MSHYQQLFVPVDPRLALTRYTVRLEIMTRRSVDSVNSFRQTSQGINAARLMSLILI